MAVILQEVCKTISLDLNSSKDSSCWTSDGETWSSERPDTTNTAEPQRKETHGDATSIKEVPTNQIESESPPAEWIGLLFTMVLMTSRLLLLVGILMKQIAEPTTRPDYHTFLLFAGATLHMLHEAVRSRLKTLDRFASSVAICYTVGFVFLGLGIVLESPEKHYHLLLPGNELEFKFESTLHIWNEFLINEYSSIMLVVGSFFILNGTVVCQICDSFIDVPHMAKEWHATASTYFELGGSVLLFIWSAMYASWKDTVDGFFLGASLCFCISTLLVIVGFLLNALRHPRVDPKTFSNIQSGSNY